MKPDWDKLMEAFADHESVGVFDVDCTANAGKPLCGYYQVHGYPQLMYGDPVTIDTMKDVRFNNNSTGSSLKDLPGNVKTEYDHLHTFVMENLAPFCGPERLDLCSDEHKVIVDKIMKMSNGKREAKIRKNEKWIIETTERYEIAQFDRDAEMRAADHKKDLVINKTRDNGYKLLRVVHGEAQAKSKVAMEAGDKLSGEYKEDGKYVKAVSDKTEL